MIELAPATNCPNCNGVLIDGRCPFCGTTVFYIKPDHLPIKRLPISPRKIEYKPVTCPNNGVVITDENDNILSNMVRSVQIEKKSLYSDNNIYAIVSIYKIECIYNDDLRIITDYSNRFKIKFYRDSKLTSEATGYISDIDVSFSVSEVPAISFNLIEG